MSARLVSLVLVLCLALTSCSGGDDTDEPDPTETASTGAAAPEAPPALDVAWTASGRAIVPVASSEELLVFFQDDTRVVALDRESGDEVSRWSVPAGEGQICSTSGQLGRGRLLGLLIRSRGNKCTIAAALDVRTGELRWRRVLPSSDPDGVPGSATATTRATGWPSATACSWRRWRATRYAASRSPTVGCSA